MSSISSVSSASGASLLAALSLAVLLIAAPAATAQQQPVVVASPVPQPPKPAPTGDEIFALGRLDGQTYTNPHFGVSLTAPKGWTIMGLEDLRAAREGAKAVFAGEKDARLRRQFEESVDRTTALFSASKLPAEAATSFNAALVCAAERVPTAVVKTPRDYYDLMMRSLKLSQGVTAEVIDAFRPMRIGPADFGLFKLKLTTPRGVMIQRLLVTIKAPYALGVVYTYTDEADAAAFDEVLASVRAR